MHICYLGDASSTHVLKWLNFFKSRNHKISLITFTPENKIDPDSTKGISLYPIRPVVFRNHYYDRLTALLKIRSIKKLVRTLAPDLVHAHNFTAYGNLTSFLDFQPIIISAWGSDVLFPEGKSIFMEYLLKKAISNAALLHCDGQKTYESLCSYGADPAKVRIIYFGVEVQRFSQSKYSYDVRHKLAIQDHEIMVLNLRGLRYPLYGAETLVNAIPIVLQNIPDAKFVFIGEGKLKDKFIIHAKNENFLENIIFPGNISNHKLPYYMASCDIYVSTSLSDSGLAVSTAEVMASGVSVIITDDRDNRLWITDNVNGFLFPPLDHVTLADRIITLAKNKTIRSKFSQMNRKLVEEKFNLMIEMTKIEKLYKMVIH